jgi:hypothetical protein
MENSKTLFLSSTVLNDLIYENQLNIIKKQEKSFCNYYFLPTIGIQLYSPKVTWIDPSKKNISFAFNKVDCSGLLTLLKHINDSLFKYISFRHKLIHKTISPLYYEKGDQFYIKCYLPNLKGNYFIKCITQTSDYTQDTSFTKEKNENFTLPRLNCVYDKVDIEIRNLWETNKQSGYCLELKKVYIDFTK